MKRILFVVGAGERGGAERALLTLARYLPAEGFEPVMAFMAQGRFVEEVEAEGISTIYLPPVPRIREVGRLRGAIGAVADAVEKTNPSIVQANGEKIAVFAGFGARRANRPCVFWLYDSPFRSVSAGFVQLAMRMSPHTAAVAPSNWMASRFRRTLMMDVDMIPYGIDIQRLPKAAADIRSIAGWDQQSIVVGFVGRLQHWKGVHVFIRAASDAAKKIPQLRIAVIGGALFGWEAAYAKELPKLAESLGLGDRIWFGGHRSDALDLMAACDVVVHSSLKPEPLGLVVPEAMGLGRAVIATRTKGPEEVIRDGITGVLVDAGDAENMTAEIARLAASPELRSRMGADAALSVRQELSAEAMASRFSVLYRRILERLPVPEESRGQ